MRPTDQERAEKIRNAAQRGPMMPLLAWEPPLKWDELTDEARKQFIDASAEPASLVPQRYMQVRWNIIRQRASLEIDKVMPYRVHPDPMRRAQDVAVFAKNLGHVRKMRALRPWEYSESYLAAWEEHYARAVHAYTRPFEPYGGTR